MIFFSLIDDYDDYSDLTPSQRSSVEEWQMQLSERYDLVGDLVRPDELEVDDNSVDTNSGDKGDNSPGNTNAAAATTTNATAHN